MNARPVLDRIVHALADCKLEVILIGNAGAALQGAPVTTLDFDFLFRKTPVNMKKLKALATALGGSVFRPYYPVSSLYRLMADEDNLQLDFMPMVHGIKSFESARSRATEVRMPGGRLLVASLPDIVRSKRAAGRPKDIAVLPILEATLDELEARSREAGAANKKTR